MATDEDRDEAIVKEARRLTAQGGRSDDWPTLFAMHALRLQREGWEPVDEDLAAAERFCLEWLGNGYKVKSLILKIIKYGREQERAK